ncbi:MAG TPA: DUF5060 domain-containing protein [Thermoanaerobaculia bacterium]|jgi:hypothetical protein|nr:DUF5060 domain-containing protein [Thermoanaerobaculia bacterium]
MSRHYSSIARTALIALVLLACASGASAQITLPACSGTLLRFSVCEIVLSSNTSYANGYLNASVTANFTLSGSSLTKTVNGFWDGGKVFKVRFNASNAGTWSYTTSSGDMSLNGKSGSFSVSSSLGTRGFVRRNSNNQEKFIFDNGTRYFMWGQTYYQIISNARDNGTWRSSIDNSFGYNMNKVRMLLFPFGHFQPHDVDTRPFTDVAHDQLDLTHWQKFDEIVNYLNQKPMIADVILFNDNAVAYAPIGSPGAKAKDERYVRYALARLAAFPNVIWCMTNEWDGDHATNNNAGYWNDLGNIVLSEDPWMNQGGNQRALSIHQKTELAFQFLNSWPTHAILQYGPRNLENLAPYDWGNYGITYNQGQSKHTLPVVNDEYGYIGEINRVAHRQAIWGIAVAGGYGSAGDFTTDQNTQPTISADWKDHPEYGDISHLVDFFVNHVSTWWQMTSQNPLVASGSHVYVLAQSGIRYVVYAATGGTFTLNLPVPSGASSYRVFLYDPTTGIEQQLFPNVGSGLQTFTITRSPHSDTGNDWVLRIEV